MERIHEPKQSPKEDKGPKATSICMGRRNSDMPENDRTRVSFKVHCSKSLKIVSNRGPQLTVLIPSLFLGK